MENKYQYREIKTGKIVEDFMAEDYALTELGLKEKLHFMSDEEQFELLASDGMLVKRPIFISSDFLIIGNSKKEYEALL